MKHRIAAGTGPTNNEKHFSDFFFFNEKVVGYQLRGKTGCSLKKRIPWLQGCIFGVPRVNSFFKLSSLGPGKIRRIPAKGIRQKSQGSQQHEAQVGREALGHLKVRLGRGVPSTLPCEPNTSGSPARHRFPGALATELGK